MSLLIVGLLLWSVHLVPALGRDVRGIWVKRLGEKGFSITFALLIASGLALIVFGWRSSVPVPLYAPPEWLRPVAYLLMVPAFMLFVASSHPTRIRSFVRHPQLTGVILWSVAHLLQNGDSRGVLLFGWLGVWALLEIFLINRRDTEWVKAVPPGWAIEVRWVAVSLVVCAAAAFAHPYIAGVTVL